jgi:hypothetical protein
MSVRKTSRGQQRRGGRVAGAAVTVAVLGGSAPAMAALISWNTPQNISGPGTSTASTTPSSGSLGTGQTISNGTNDVNTQGNLVFGVNYSGTPGSTFPFDATIGGQTFLSFRNTISGYADSFGNSTTGFAPLAAAGQSYGNFTQPAFIGGATDYTLANGKFAGAASASITLSGLTPGDVYLVQFWVTDPRSFGIGRAETISAGASDTNVPTLHYNQGVTGTEGQWVTGTFVADASHVQALNVSASADAQVNLFQLRDVTGVPEPTGLGLLALSGAALLSRRRGK